MILGFIQARLGSSRLPGKVMLPIVGKPMLWHVWSRAKRAASLDDVVVLTSDQPNDDPIASYCIEQGIRCFRGSESDVVDRFETAAEEYKPDSIVRITGDCPLVDPQIIDKIVQEYRTHGVDYCSTSPSYSYPDGFGVEVVSRSALRIVNTEVRSSVDREHVTSYLRRNPNHFKLRFVENEKYHPFFQLHLSVDDEADLKLVSRIFEENDPQNPCFGLQDVLDSLRAHPEWLKDYPNTPTNEGYYKSLLTDSARQRPQLRPVQVEQSEAFLQRAIKVIPSCTQTFSKGYTQYVKGVSPLFVERGHGGIVYDVDGNDYIDYPLGLGAITLGHCHPDVDEAVIAQVRKSPSHSLPHRFEVELAEKLCEIIPSAEMVRFGKNGSDATAGAVRLARAVTGREKIACCGYHGWQDWYIGTTTRRKGVPKSTQELTLAFPFGNIEALKGLLEQNPGQIAAIIMEPIGSGMPPEGYLQQVKELAHRHGALFILDEIVTGFRLALGGAQQYFNVTPDLSCIGKGMSNGYPISAVVGQRALMEELDRCFFSFTFGGEAVSLAAALATIDVFERENVTSRMWILGRKLQDGYNYLSREYGLSTFTWCQGLAPRSIIVFKDRQGQDSLLFKSIFQQECVRRGVLFCGVHKFCLMHTQEQIEYTIEVYDEAFKVLKEAYESDNPETMLMGKMLEPVFRKNEY